MFSEHETMILKILGKKKMTIAELTEEFYKIEDDTLEPNNYISSIIRRITKKCEFHDLDWTLVGKGVGRSGRTVWREKR